MEPVTKDYQGYTLLYHKSPGKPTGPDFERGNTTVTADAQPYGKPEQWEKTYPAGYRALPTTWPLPCAMRHIHNFAIPMRDGVKLYAEVYLPAYPVKVPALINWTPFDKGPNPAHSQDGDKGVGMPDAGYISGFETFEGFDPAWWVNHEYAVVNVDVRGAYYSEGNGEYFSNDQDSDDICDAIDFLSKQDWCSGKCAMVGNSWLGICQWYAAAKHPPALACIVPWEGHANMYRDEYMRGGIPKFNGSRDYFCNGDHYQEDLKEMMRQHPFMDAYWESRIAPFEEITVPAYVVASYTNWCHVNGTFEGFRKIKSEKKWLRVHNLVEWPDMYNYENAADCLKFLDRYTKDIENDWEQTPRVRLAVLNPGGEDIVNRPEEDWPLARQQFKRIYLDAANARMLEENPAAESSVSYDSEAPVTHYQLIRDVFKNDTGARRVTFDYDIPEDMEVTGYVRLRLWVECQGSDDMDLFFRILTLDKDGNYIYHDCCWNTYSGPDNRLRVSLRELDPEKSTPDEPQMLFKHPQKLHPGEIVPIDVTFWPTALLLHKGEKLRLVVAGYDYMGFPPMGGKEENRLVVYNKGTHVVHAGGKYESYLSLPVIPEK